MDKLDILMLKELKKNGIISFEALARHLDVTSSTIKNRIRRLKEIGALGKFYLEPVIPVDRILVLLTTNGTEDKKQFIQNLGVHPAIRSVTPFSDGRYMMLAHSYGVEEITELDRFLREESCFLSVDIHPLIGQQDKHQSITQMQYAIIRSLENNPRKSYTDIAVEINRSVKGVRKGIQRLVDSGIVGINVQVYLSMLFVIIKPEISQHHEEISQWLFNEFPTLWEVMVSSLEPIIFGIFATDRVNEINEIMDKLRNESRITLCESVVCGPTAFF